MSTNDRLQPVDFSAGAKVGKAQGSNDYEDNSIFSISAQAACRTQAHIGGSGGDTRPRRHSCPCQHSGSEWSDQRVLRKGQRGSENHRCVGAGLPARRDSPLMESDWTDGTAGTSRTAGFARATRAGGTGRSAGPSRASWTCRSRWCTGPGGNLQRHIHFWTPRLCQRQRPARGVYFSWARTLPGCQQDPAPGFLGLRSDRCALGRKR